MNIKPIAYFRSPLTSKFGIPRQSGVVEDLIGEIAFEPEYSSPDAIRGLEGFDYIWLIWGFSANKHEQRLSIPLPMPFVVLKASTIYGLSGDSQPTNMSREVSPFVHHAWEEMNVSEYSLHVPHSDQTR